MFRYSILFMILLSTLCVLRAGVIRVGSTLVTVPAPEGYVRVTDAMPQVQQAVAHMEAPEIDTLATYISPQAAEIGLGGGLPALERYFFLRVAEQVSEKVFSAEEFELFRSVVISEQEEIFSAAQELLPDLMQRLERNLADASGADASMPSAEMVPLGIYLNEADALAFSTMAILGADTDGAGARIMLTSCVFLNVSGKMVVLYATAYGEMEALEWTRESSTKWAMAILAATPPAPATSARKHGAAPSSVPRWLRWLPWRLLR